MPETLTYVCPFCDREVRVGKSCPGCAGTSRKTKPARKSWEGNSTPDGLDLPDDDFDYDSFIAREFGDGSPHRRIGAKWYWWLLGILALAAMAAGLVSGGK